MRRACACNAHARTHARTHARAHTHTHTRQVGTKTDVCFVAENSNGLRSTKRCYPLDVRAAIIRWSSRLLGADGTPGEAQQNPNIHQMATVGCELRYKIEANHDFYTMHVQLQDKPSCSSCTPVLMPSCSPCTSSGVSVRMCSADDLAVRPSGVGEGSQNQVEAGPPSGVGHEGEACCGNGKCDGFEMGSSCPQDCPADELSLTQTQVGTDSNGYNSAATLHFRPKRGMEGRTVLLCVTARATSQGGYLSVVQERTATNAPSLCYVFSVERCSFCVQYRGNLESISASYLLNQHWLRLYNTNPAILRPDRIPIAQRLAVGPVYSVVSGDTLLSIAAMAKTTVKAILANNPDVWDAPSLMPQTQLCLPLCSAPAIH